MPTVYSNPSQKPRFSKTFFKPEEFETPALRFHVKGKDFENGTFRNQSRHENHVIS